MRHTPHFSLRALTSVSVLGLTALALPSAHAATATAQFQVTANVSSACAVTAPPTLAFGNYSPATSSALAANTVFNVICTLNTPYSLGLDAGVNGTVTARKMKSAAAPTTPVGSNLLAYGLFKDATATPTNWDNTNNASGYVATGILQPYTIYGSIPAGQYTAAPVNNYVDTITLTLTY